MAAVENGWKRVEIIGRSGRIPALRSRISNEGFHGHDRGR